MRMEHIQPNWTISTTSFINMSSLETNNSCGHLAPILNSSCGGNDTLDNGSNKTKSVAGNGNDYFTIILLTMMALILVIGTVGNSVVCYVFGFKQRKRRSVPETLFLYLGAIDLTSSIVNPSLYIYWTITKYSRWDFGIVGCKILASLAPISVTLSALIILIIAVDRYFVICGQFGRGYSRKRIHCAVILAAILAISLYVPYIILLKVNDKFPCFVESIVDPVYAYSTIFVLLLQDVGFIAVLSFTNSKTFSFLQRHGTAMMERSLEARRVRSNRRVAKILLAMSCVFCVLVLPRDITQLAYIISWLNPPGFKFTKTMRNINALFKVLQTANSCVNVFIYSKMHTKFRVHLMSLCYPTCGRKRLLPEDLHSTMMTMTNITPKLRKKIFKLSDVNGTPSDTPNLRRKQASHENNANGEEVVNPLLNIHGERLSRVTFQTDTINLKF